MMDETVHANCSIALSIAPVSKLLIKKTNVIQIDDLIDITLILFCFRLYNLI